MEQAQRPVLTEPPTGIQSKQHWVALLGRRDAPTDGVEDYCSFLGRELQNHGVVLHQARVQWSEKGWIAALRSLWAESANWRDSWVLLQYTTMAWSRRGFPFGVCAVLSILRRRGLRCAVVFHEPFRQDGNRWIDRLRGRLQDWVIRRLYSRATKAIFLDPLEKIGWLPSGEAKAAFVPIGANLPDTPSEAVASRENGDVKTVAVFCLSDAPNRHGELEDIAHAMRSVAREGMKARAVFVGRGTAEAKDEIDRLFDSGAGQVVNFGLQSAEEVRRILSGADAMLCVRGPLYMRRGSAIAGIACGLPIVGYAGEAEGTPLEEAGLELVPYLDRDALGKAVARVLRDKELLGALREKSRSALQHQFSWSAVAAKMVGALDSSNATGASMNVLIYSVFFLPVTGGVQTNVFELASGLSEWRQDPSKDPRIAVTVVTRTAEPAAAEDSWPFRVVRRPSLVGLLRLLRRADVIHIAGPAMLPMILGLPLRKPVLIEHHGYQAVCPNGLLQLATDRTVCPGHFMARRYAKCVRCNAAEMGWLGSLRSLTLQFFRRWLCKRVSGNIAITDHVARRIVLPRTRTILYGISDVGCAPLLQNGKPPQIGYVGRLVPEKGLPILLKAARRLHDDGVPFALTFVGDGPLRKQLEAQSRELGLASRVAFTGDLADADLDRAVRSLQIVVMPSLWEETAGLAAIEQMMRGQVVIVADIGGLGEVVGDAGLKFSAGDSNDLYARLCDVLEDPSKAASLRAAARGRATRLFSRDAMVRLHVSAYREALGS